MKDGLGDINQRRQSVALICRFVLQRDPSIVFIRIIVYADVVGFPAQQMDLNRRISQLFREALLFYWKMLFVGRYQQSVGA